MGVSARFLRFLSRRSPDFFKVQLSHLHCSTTASLTETAKALLRMVLYYEKVPSDAEQEVQPLKPLAFTKTSSPRIRLSEERVGSPSMHRVQVCVACVAYALVGPSLVMVNNHILKQLHFPYPLILSSIGLVTTAVVCWVTLRVGAFAASRREEAANALQPQTPSTTTAEQGDAMRTLEGPMSPAELRPVVAEGMPSVDFGFWVRNMVPIGAAQGLTFFGTNAAYMYLTITFTQMLAAFTPTVTLVLLYCTGAPCGARLRGARACI